jgi:hypothetical protein
MRMPSFSLNSPTPATFTAGASEITDGSGLIFFRGGRLLSHFLGPRVERSCVEYARRLADALVGADFVVENPKNTGASKVHGLHVALYASVSVRQLTGALGGPAPLQELLGQCWIVDPSWKAHFWQRPDLNCIRSGCQAYAEAVRLIYGSRHWEKGLKFTVTDETHQELLNGIRVLETEIESNVPAEYLTLISGWRSLPYRILWTIYALNASYGACEGAVRTAVYMSRWTVNNQVALVRGIVDAENRRRELQKRKEMLDKFKGEGSMTFRELARRYPDQRRSVHEPTLQALLDEGAIVVDNNERYSLAKVVPEAS